MNRFRGILASGAGWMTGTILPIFDNVTKDEIIFWLQVVSFLFAIIAALFTIKSSKRKKS